MSTILGPSDYVLESVNLYYTGHVEPPTWMKQLTGTIRSGMILRDVSFEVHSGEIMAILGSKGSGKKALLDVIASRASGVKKGYVLLNGVTINRRLFDKAASYMSGVNDRFLQPGITVHQTLHYQACLSLNVPASVRKVRIRQVLSDIAMTQAGGTNVDKLTPSERRRLSIGVQLIKDPVVLLADEPAWSLDPLNTYFIVSILSNYAKKYGRIVVMTMEKPRSDIFPFMDRVTYLCLGDVVYSGNTRLMLDYFRTIGFPCPEVENPLMYYLCLATVDRRSHEKFIESNNQIGLLVDKFKLEGNQFRKGGFSGGPEGGGRSVTPLHALGTPRTINKIGTLIMRNLATTFLFSLHGLQQIFFRLLFLPFLFFIIWIFYFGAKGHYQHTYVTQNGLILNTLAVTYFSAIWSTLITYETHRKRYYQETREGLYAGTTYIFSYSLSALPFNVITCLMASRIVFEVTGLTETTDWLLSFCVMLTCYLLAQQHTLGTLLTIKNRMLAAAALIAFHSLTIALSSGTVRALRALPDYLYYLTYITQPRYAGGFLNQLTFLQFNTSLPALGNDTREHSCYDTEFGRGCRYLNGTHYLRERYFYEGDNDDLNYYLNFGLCFGFPLVAFLINLMVYTVPLPLLVKNKFRE